MAIDKYNVKVGSRVRILDTKNTRYWKKSIDCIGTVIVLDERDVDTIASISNSDRDFHPCGNKYAINFKLTDFEVVSEEPSYEIY